nr:MAG TPA: hypothetical protein [Caudoviricetes sp.]
MGIMLTVDFLPKNEKKRAFPQKKKIKNLQAGMMYHLFAKIRMKIDTA